MRHSRRMMAVSRQQPLTLKHAWWSMEELENGVHVRNRAGGEPMIVVNPSSVWSFISSGIVGNRISKSAQTVGNFVYTEDRLTNLDFLEHVCVFAFIWPESTDLNSDSYTQSIIGQPAWLVGEAGFNLSVYNANSSASCQNGRGGNSSLSNFAVMGAIGALKLYVWQFNAADGKVSASLNGASQSVASTGMPFGPVTNLGARFNLGNYVRRTVTNPDVTNPANRNLRGKWDEVCYMKGKLLTNADITWLYNSAAGRSYEDAVDYGLFRGGTA